jgi:hypothetical protein
MYKYAALKDFLARQRGDRITMSYAQLESIIDGGLPKSAHVHSAWWENERTDLLRHTQCKAWLEAGWEVESVELGRIATFIRIGT